MKKSKKNKGKRIISFLTLLLIIVCSAYLIYLIYLLKDIETFFRICGIGALIFIIFIFFVIRKKILKKGKNIPFIILLLIMILYLGALSFITYNFNNVYGKISNVTTSGYTTYSSSIVTLTSNKAESINDIGSKSIGMIKDKNNLEGNTIPKEIIKKNKLKNKIIDYDNYIDMINDLQDNKIEYIFLPTKYPTMFKNMEGYEDIETTTKIIYTQTKKVKKQTKVNRGGKLTEPFTILLMGVDSEEENIADASFNGDALMLITFNPKTLNTTILSIPRDTYVPIACFNGKRKNKITHAAWYGEECMMSTIENFTGIDIDYFVKINFKGVVSLVDALGGVDVDVPIEFCEQDSNRDFSNEICLNKGMQTLNGEQALALSRHRKTINDFVRGQNQQLVVQGLLNKFKDIKDLKTINGILDTISNNMETNMSTTEILSFYNIAKELAVNNEGTSITDLISFQRLYLSGYDQYIYDYSSASGGGTGLSLYNFVPYKGSIEDVVKAMKNNLNSKREVKKTFSFSVDQPYEEVIIGKGEYNESGIALLPSFIGDDSSVAASFCSRYGIPLKIQYVSASYPSQRIGQIIDQSLPADMDVDEISKSSGLTITVVESEYVGNDTKVEEKTDKKDTVKDDEEKEKDTEDNDNSDGDNPSQDPSEGGGGTNTGDNKDPIGDIVNPQNSSS